jgi:hypothetical protein
LKTLWHYFVERRELLRRPSWFRFWLRRKDRNFRDSYDLDRRLGDRLDMGFGGR